MYEKKPLEAVYSKHWKNFNTCEDSRNASVYFSPNTR